MMREEEKHNPRKSRTQQFFKKRWVFPAIYLASAAIILTAVLWYQSSTNDLADSTDITVSDVPTAGNQEVVEVVSNVEKFAMPVADVDSVEVQKQFYDDKATEAEQEAALVFYENRYAGNTGIDIKNKDGKSFDVVASLSGTVTKVEKDPLLGFLVVLEHGDGITTMYSALENVKVEEGAKVAQGEMLATAGRSLYNEEAGIHTHFEIRKGDDPVNPLDFFEETLASLLDENEEASTESEAGKDAADKEEDKGTEEEEPEQGDEDSEVDTTDTPDASIGQGKA
ncbi:peptidoglycan DD-metalloendopeptidase family protein [Bacillus sp. DJP31]|uniref:peptidoglycan DD-metalloendopeptidase family protein n=1 Tax=Bacillus sp. DJP31 TaxID=3409789 RepID=UPI003BB5817F